MRDRVTVFALGACARHGTIAICDEVWEHVLFDGRRHYPLLDRPGMEGLAVKIGSAGKIFSTTGWKVGFVMAPPALLEPIARAHKFLTFTTPPALQSAIGYGRESFGDPDNRTSSVADQEMFARTDAERYGLEFVAWHSDNGITGATMERPGLGRVLDAIRQGAVTAIIIEDVDRLSRDRLHDPQGPCWQGEARRRNWRQDVGVWTRR